MYVLCATVFSVNKDVCDIRCWRQIQSLPVFCSRLKTHLFSRSFCKLYCCACEVTLVITDTIIAVLTYLLTYLRCRSSLQVTKRLTHECHRKIKSHYLHVVLKLHISTH